MMRTMMWERGISCEVIKWNNARNAKMNPLPYYPMLHESSA